MPPSQPTKRACDACHRRKVKCNGDNPCQNCGGAQLNCTYNSVPQKKGPKGSRAKVISELRESQRGMSIASRVSNRIRGLPNPAGPPDNLPSPGLVTGCFVKDCIAYFCANLQEHMPFFDRASLESQIMYMEHNPESYCMLTALAAYTMIQPGGPIPRQGSDGHAAAADGIGMMGVVGSTILVEEAVRVRKRHDFLGAANGCVSLNTIATSLFFYAFYDSMELHQRAWFYLREAATLVIMAGMDQEPCYDIWPMVESEMRRRFFWAVYMAERQYAIKHNRPVSLSASNVSLPTSPTDRNDMAAGQVRVFVAKATAFKSLDDPKLLTLWSKTLSSLSGSSYVDSAKATLEDEVLRPLRAQDPAIEDLQTNLGFLRNLEWACRPPSTTNNTSGRFSDMARDTASALASNFPNSSGLAENGLIQKLLEVTISVVDCLTLQSEISLFAPPRRPEHYLASILGPIRHSDNRFLPLLLHATNDFLMKLASTLLRDVPEGCATVDIFDGFGNAGMAQMPLDLSIGHPVFDGAMSSMAYDERLAPIASQSPPQPAANMNQHFQQPLPSPTVITPPSQDFMNYGQMRDMLQEDVNNGRGGVAHNNNNTNHHNASLGTHNTHSTHNIHHSPSSASDDSRSGHHVSPRYDMCARPPSMHVHNSLPHNMNSAINQPPASRQGSTASHYVGEGSILGVSMASPLQPQPPHSTFPLQHMTASLDELGNMPAFEGGHLGIGEFGGMQGLGMAIKYEI